MLHWSSVHHCKLLLGTLSKARVGSDIVAVERKSSACFGSRCQAFLPLLFLVHRTVGQGVVLKLLIQMQQGSRRLLPPWFHEESSCLLLGMPCVLMSHLILVWKHLNIIDLGKGVPMVQIQAIVLMKITL